MGTKKLLLNRLPSNLPSNLLATVKGTMCSFVNVLLMCICRFLGSLLSYNIILYVPQSVHNIKNAFKFTPLDSHFCRIAVLPVLFHLNNRYLGIIAHIFLRPARIKHKVKILASRPWKRQQKNIRKAFTPSGYIFSIFKIAKFLPFILFAQNNEIARGYREQNV